MLDFGTMTSIWWKFSRKSKFNKAPGNERPQGFSLLITRLFLFVNFQNNNQLKKKVLIRKKVEN